MSLEWHIWTSALINKSLPSFIGSACLLCLFPISACDELGMKTTYQPNDSATEEIFTDLAVAAIEPNYGSLTGGTSITISGHGFIGDVSVSFGNMALDITVIDAETILCSSPSSPSEGQVAINIESDLGSVTLENGFTYTDSIVEPSTEVDTGVDTGTSSGLTGGMVEMWRKVNACTTCFDPPPPQHVIEASVSIHTPQAGSWYSWFPPINSCIDQVNQVTLGNTDQFGSISLTGAGTVSLFHDSSQGSYTNNNVASSAWTYNSHYDLETSDFSIPQALRTPEQGFTVIEPALAFSENGFMQAFSKSNFSILWEPYGSSDYILFLLEVYSAQSSYSLLCLTEDTGGFGLDPSLLANYPSNEAAVISLYRLQVTESIHPLNNSTIEGVSAVGIIGTGYLSE